MKFAKPLLVVGLVFAFAPVLGPGCSSSSDDGGSGGAGGGGGDGDGGSGAGGKGGSTGGTGGSAAAGKGGSSSGGSGGNSSSGGAAGGSGGATGGTGGATGGTGGANTAGAGGMNTGGSGAGGSNAGGSGGGAVVAAKFKSDIMPILAQKCAMCHNNEYVTGPLARLMKTTSEACGGGIRVVKGSAATSPVVKKVKGGNDACGMRRMPLVFPAGCSSNNCAVPCQGGDCLSADQIAKLESWINAGATDN